MRRRRTVSMAEVTSRALAQNDALIGDEARLDDESRRFHALALAVECMKPHATQGNAERVVNCAKVFEAYLRGDAQDHS